MTRPMETHTKGNLCTKFVVPSRGSTTQVGASVKSGIPLSEDSSSPINCQRIETIVRNMSPCCEEKEYTRRKDWLVGVPHGTEMMS